MFEHPSHKVSVRDNEYRVKIVAFGSYHSGKTTFIKCIDPHPVLTDARNYDGFTTVALDLGIKEHKGYKLYIYGTPGQERFDVAREVISFGLHAGLVIVDATRGMTDFEKQVLSELRSRKIPCLVLANKLDLPGASLDKVRNDASGYDCIMPVSSRTGQGVNDVLDKVVEMVRQL